MLNDGTEFKKETDNQSRKITQSASTTAISIGAKARRALEDCTAILHECCYF